jgi:thioredoxin reductase (NADPH)
MLCYYSEFDRLLAKHSTETGLPVVVDFYSDGCGPCRMMAPIFKKLAGTVKDKAVFVKVDTNTMNELSSRYQIRSLPTFVFFLHGKIWNQFSGAGEQQLNQMTQQVMSASVADNVIMTTEALVSYYAQVDPTKDADFVQGVYKKCVDMVKGSKECVASAANQLARRLKKKYGSAPNMAKRFTGEVKMEGDEAKEGGKEAPKPKKTSATAAPKTPSLATATKEELMKELQLRLDAEREKEFEEEDDDHDEDLHSYDGPGNFPERVVIIGGGPAGMSAAIYAARAGLTPVVIAPPMGGQLQGKGVDVENYPGLHNMTGPGVIAAMRIQAALFGAVFEASTVETIDASARPLKVIIENGTTIETHSIIVATGAESNWLQVPGEYELRGNGVSSCATCDGNIFRGKDVVVVGGGDTAMEDALVLARTSRTVTVVHRRDSFRASKVLAQRVMEHPKIAIQWMTVVHEIVGQVLEDPSNDSDSVDLDNLPKVVKSVVLKNVETDELTTLYVDAVFVAIGHTPSTKFLEGIVDFQENHTGYVKTVDGSTKTSVPGIFCAGDVSDAVYRQAITSAGSGAAAALDAERWLSEEGLGNEAAEMEAELLREMMSDVPEKSSYNVYSDAGGRVEGMKESFASEL